MLLQVMPPTLKEKLDNKNWPDLKASLKLLTPQRRTEAKARIKDLTFLETQQLVRSLHGVSNADDVLSAIVTAWESCTLEGQYDTGQGREGAAVKWRDVCQREAEHLCRIPSLKK